MLAIRSCTGPIAPSYASICCTRYWAGGCTRSVCPPRRCTIAFAALAVTRFIEDRTGWSIRKFVRTAHGYRTTQVRAGHHTITAEDPLPPDLCDAPALI